MDENAKTPANNGSRKKIAMGIFIFLTIVGGVVIFFYLQYKSAHISTDDAFIDGHVHIIASKVPGTVKAVPVEDNAPVKKGDLLVEIDETDYDVRVREAGSGLNAEKAKRQEAEKRVEVAKRQFEELGYRVEAAKANLVLQEANLRQAELDLQRTRGLLEKEAIPKDRFDRTRTAYDVAVAQVKASRDQLRQVEASLETQKATIRQAESSVLSQSAVISQRDATLKTAELNQGYTRIFAPVDGYVTKRSVERGNQIQAGQPLMAVVPLSDIWVIANYKETQLEKVKPGQSVDIKVDTFPGKVFKGKVDSIMAGTGAAFSLFPPENATGNFVKVVQRVPVKVVFEKDADKDHVLRVGMSVAPTVIVK